MSNRHHICRGALTLVIAIFVYSNSARAQEMEVDIRPDLCPVRSALFETFNWYTDSATYLLFSNAVANVGPWELYLEPSGSIDTLTLTRPARQRVGQATDPEDTLYRYYSAGNFEWHGAPGHRHVHFGKLSQYSIRACDSTGGVSGEPLASGDKVGFCLIDSDQYQEDSCCGSPPSGSPSTGVFATCVDSLGFYGAFHEGISKGWRDEYDFLLSGQWIDISDIAPGIYWLESVVDPDVLLKQESRANDTARIRVFIALKDVYEPNNSKTAVDTMPLAGPLSPNLGACQSVIDSLSIDREFRNYNLIPDIDYFRISLPGIADASDSIAIIFGDSSSTDIQDGELDIAIRDADGDSVPGYDAVANENGKTIALEDLAAGTYYVVVAGHASSVNQWNANSYYKLVLSLPSPECGDVNGDGVVNASDVVMLVGYLNNGGPLGCPDKANVDSESCEIDADDLSVLVDYVYGIIQELPANACTCP